ncbi:probable salivary secreted peptide [Aedes albopictus]|uniref:Salivary secreted peptide n=1 Tax=Aedes albopictus TaxID=7160 RepID=A0ABM1Z4F5_AEDAL
MRVILTTFVILLTATALIYADSNQWGRRVVGDRLLNASTIVNNSLPVPIKTAVFQYLPPLGSARAPNVTYILARDNVRNGLGGYAALISGGINQTHASVKLSSRPNLGFNFTVEVYGR